MTVCTCTTHIPVYCITLSYPCKRHEEMYPCSCAAFSASSSWEANDSTNRLKSKTGCLTVRTRNHSHQTERSNNKQSQKCTEVGPALWILQPYVKICLHQAKPRHFPSLYWHRLPSGYPQRERGLILSATYSLSSTVTSFFTMWYMLYHILPSLWWFSAATNATRDI